MRSERAEELLALDPPARRRALRQMNARQRRALRTHWHLWAHDGQLPPAGHWHAWLIMAGRGFGKTRAGAEWVRAAAEADPQARIALVGASLGEARRVMVEGPSGLLAISPSARRPDYEPSKRQLTWPNGAQATLYSAAEPESLRGPQHSHAWCDEIAKWEQASGKAEAAWDNLMLGLRLGAFPRVAATTTPRAVALLRRLLDEPGTVVSRGPTLANADNLPPGFLLSIRELYGNSALGRQELDGELLAEVEGALWTRSMLEHCRFPGAVPDAVRTVVAVDPPASDRGDACGIVVVMLGADGTAWVVADCSLEKASPERWARAVAETARVWAADRVVAEKNQGGQMVESVLRAADCTLPLRGVHARKGKAARAEPVAALYETGKVRHGGLFAELEDQLCGLIAGGRYEGPGRSPDRADALVYALTELMLGPKVEPRVWVV